MGDQILVTGAAGFIGFHVAKRLLDCGYVVTGYDNINGYYEESLKIARIGILGRYPNFSFIKADLDDRSAIGDVFRKNKFYMVINLAAQAGVRYSLENPYCYIESNILGFMNVLEACRQYEIGHLIYASSSSVYGANTNIPFSVHENVDHPVSLYAATKKANELMAHSYAALYKLPCTGLRFFTVYGPYGRPDMAYYKFTKAIANGEALRLFNYGRMKRDFTYIDDIVEGIIRLMHRPPQGNPLWNALNPDPGSSFAPYKIYNIGNNNPIELLRMVEILEELLDRKAILEFMPMQPGDVQDTYADIEDLTRDIAFTPRVQLEEGLSKFVDWYRKYYEI
jgi:Nucleoside-diphosphate-sugar epimerases